MTDAMHKADVRGKERKALRRAAHPEVKTKYPPAQQRGKGRFGIRYRYRTRMVSEKTFERWYVKERGRDQALAKMARPWKIGKKTIPSMYTDLEKIRR